MPRGQSEGTNMRQQPKLWDSQRQRKKKRERENYPAKSPNLRHCQANSQNKGLSRASQLRTGPSPTREGRQEQSEPERGNHGPREASSTKLQTGFIANQEFLGFWTVDIGREGHSQRSAPQQGHTAHLGRCVHGTPQNRVAGTGGG